MSKYFATDFENESFQNESFVKRMSELIELNSIWKAVIKPGWNREEVSVLAHEAREAKAKAAELTVSEVTVMKLKDWFIANLFVISLVVFNAACLYVYLQLMQPLDDWRANRKKQQRKQQKTQCKKSTP